MEHLTLRELLEEAAIVIEHYLMRDGTRAYESAVMNTDNPHLVPSLDYWLDEAQVRLVVALREKAEQA
jgi:hypothetical protein